MKPFELDHWRVYVIFLANYSKFPHVFKDLRSQLPPKRDSLLLKYMIGEKEYPSQSGFLHIEIK